jgi:OFA family oxalate/formate antiporter-like MFS transporter
MENNLGNRWRFVVAALVMQLCLGALYSWAVFRGPLETLHGWSKSTSIAPFRYSLLFFTIAMILAGFWQDRKGPRLVGSVGGLLLGTGCLLAAWLGDTPGGLIFAYGILGGLGVGFAYVTPIATCIKWFPDKRGMVVGLAVMGFGAGSLIFAPLLESLIGTDAAQYASTIPRTFVIMAVIFYLFVIGAAQVYRVPPAGWSPAGWSPPAATVRLVVALLSWNFGWTHSDWPGLTDRPGNGPDRRIALGGHRLGYHVLLQWNWPALLGEPVG